MIKSLIHYSCAAGLAAILSSASLYGQDAAPGSVDFGHFSPSASGGEFVEVNVSSNIIAMVTKLAGPSEPEIAEVVRGLQHIRVNVIALDDGNRASVLERFKAIRDSLDKKGWEKVVVVQGKDQDVAVQIKTRGNDTVEGVAVTVVDGGREAVMVNIVGDVKPEKLAVIGERFNIEPLKKLGIAPKKSS